MADRCLIWHIPDVPFRQSLPVYYLDADYAKGAVRIYAEKAPEIGDLEVDILADGVSIFNDHSPYFGTSSERNTDTSISLPMGEQYEDNAEDFTSDALDEGTWMKLSIIDLAGARNVTVQLELNKLSDDEEAKEE